MYIGLFNLCVYLVINYSSPSLLPEAIRFRASCYRVDGSEYSAQTPGGDIEAKGYPEKVPKYQHPMQLHRDYSTFLDHTWMPRLLTQQLHAQAMRLMRDVTELFKQNDVTFFMVHGTLLGSFFFHDIIPWDDDLDIMIPFRDVNKVRSLLRRPDVHQVFAATSYKQLKDVFSEENLQFDVDLSKPSKCGFSSSSVMANDSCFHKFHLFYRGAPKTFMRQNVGYPFIDAKFYNENDTHIYFLDSADGEPFPKDYLYPVHYRPLFDLWQPSPAQPRQYLKHFFSKFECSSKWYSHLSQSIAVGHHVSCDDITGCYPHVEHVYNPLDPQCTPTLSLERLRIGDKILYEVTLPEPCTSNNKFAP